MIYLDSCALVKLVVEEPESAALRSHLVESRSPLVSSELAKVEAHRALHRVNAEEEDFSTAGEVLADIANLPLAPAVEGAARLPDPCLCSLDALHLETAQLLGRALTQFITYDPRLAKAAEALGLPVMAPGAA